MKFILPHHVTILRMRKKSSLIIIMKFRYSDLNDMSNRDINSSPSCRMLTDLAKQQDYFYCSEHY